MKRTPLKSKSELKRTRPLKEGKPLKKKNVRRASKRFTEAFGLKASWIRGLSCVVAALGDDAFAGLFVWPCAGRVEAAHTKSRGAGGTSEHLIPMCQYHHRQQHDIGQRTFEARYALDLEKLAAEYERRFQEEAE
jgi:hypothetical protein